MKPIRLLPSETEVTAMNDTQRKQIRQLREEGKSYSQISEALAISQNTVKTYCNRHGLGRVEMSPPPPRYEEKQCQCCGKTIRQIQGRKEKRFCSNFCRNKWWNTHLDQVNRKANYEFECAFCKKPFTAYGNKTRKYCCHECYIADRFGGNE